MPRPLENEFNCRRLICWMTLFICPFLAEGSDASAGPSSRVQDGGQRSKGRVELSVNVPVTPDQFWQPQDGDDDAPSINRAIAALARSKHNQLSFLARPYLLNSAVMQDDVAVHWKGLGWSEPSGAISSQDALGVGTWLVVDRPDFAPITITGFGSRGTIFENIGVFQKQPVVPAAGSWRPTPFRYVFNVESTYGLIRFQHMMFLAVTNGISAHLSGRLEIDGMYGQIFNNAVKVDKSYDANTYRDLHFWPYWTQLVPALSYSQNHFDAVWLQRADTGVIDNLFVFGARSGIRLDQSNDESGTILGGSATKNTLTTIHCDFTRWCVWVTGYNVHFQAGSIDSQGQQWTGTGTLPIAMKDAAAIRIDGQAVIQVGRIWQEFTDHSTISYLNSRFASEIQLGSLYEDFTYSDSHPAHTTMTSTTLGHSILVLSAPPMTVLRLGQLVVNDNETTNGLVLTH